MTAAGNTTDLPKTLSVLLRPWIGVVASAPVGMGQSVRVAAENASISLWRRVVVLPELERGLANALSASHTLAYELDRRHAVPFQARLDAQSSLDALIALLHEARPNERAKGLGLGW